MKTYSLQSEGRVIAFPFPGLTPWEETTKPATHYMMINPFVYIRLCYVAALTPVKIKNWIRQDPPPSQKYLAGGLPIVLEQDGLDLSLPEIHICASTTMFIRRVYSEDFKMYNG